MRAPVAALAVAYLTTVLAANLAISHFGPDATALVALLAVGPVLTIRDALHNHLGDRWLTIAALAPLVAAGAALSYVLGDPAVAAASAVAFAAAEVADGVVYMLVARQRTDVRVLASNLVGGTVDSILFPALAFGGIAWDITTDQLAAKIVGGALALVVIRRMLR